MPGVQVRTIADIEQAMAQTYAGIPGAEYRAELQPGEYDPTAAEVTAKKLETFSSLCDFVMERGVSNFRETHTEHQHPPYREAEVSLGRVILGSPITINNSSEVQTNHGRLRAANKGRRQLIGSMGLWTLNFRDQHSDVSIVSQIQKRDPRGLRIGSWFAAEGFDLSPGLPKLIAEKTNPDNGIVSHHVLGVSFEGRPTADKEDFTRRTSVRRIPFIKGAPEKPTPQAGNEAFGEFVAAGLTMQLLEQLSK